MRITRLFLRNYRVFEELELELPPGLIGIFGPNGSGKSTLLESIQWAIYGRARTPKEDICTAGVNADCMAELEFEHEGHLYLVRRTISGAANTVKCEVHADRALMAEGVVDSRRYLQSILGMDEAAFKASVFAEQKQLAAFSTDVRPEQRKRLVLSLLGITPLESARDLARKDAREARETYERMRSLLQDLDELQQKADLATATAERTAGEAAAEAAVAATAKEALAETERALERLDEVRREYDALVQEGQSARAEADRAKAAIERLELELADLADAESALERLRADADGVEEIERRAQLGRAVVEARKAVAAITVPAEPAAPDESRLDAAIAEAESAGAALGEARGRLASAEAELKRAEGRLSRSADLSGEEACPTCGQELGDSFEQVHAHWQAEVEAARAEVDAIRAVVDERAAAASAAGKAVERERSALKAAQEAWQAYERQRARRADAEGALAAAVEAFGGDVDETALADLDRVLQAKRAAAAACQRMEGRLVRKPAAAAELAREVEARDHADARRQTLLEKVHALGFDKEAYAAAREAREEARQRADLALGAAQQAALLAERAAGEARSAQEALAAATEQHARIADLEADARHLERVAALLHSFRADVVNTVGPRLSAQAAELFGELTDHEYDRLEVDPDTYDIKIHDAGRAYAISRFSGSETDLANLALRVAISEHVTFQTGGAVGLLVLDEVFGALDDDRRERMLLALERLRARFRQVLVVTHETEIKEQLPSAIEVQKLPGRRATARLAIA